MHTIAAMTAEPARALVDVVVVFLVQIGMLLWITLLSVWAMPPQGGHSGAPLLSYCRKHSHGQSKLGQDIPRTSTSS